MYSKNATVHLSVTKLDSLSGSLIISDIGNYSLMM